MEKVVLNKESVKSVMDMYASKDKDNHLVANEIVNNCDTEKSKAWLVLLYAESNKDNSYWEENIPNVIDVVRGMGVYSEYKPTVNNVLTTLIDLKAKADVVDLFLQLHVERLKKSMASWGYPVDKLNYSITLKDDKE